MRKILLRLGYSSMGLAVLVLLLNAMTPTNPYGASDQLFFTGDLYGYLKPCG